MSADTPLDIEIELDRLVALRSGAERVRMACEMFDCARSIAVDAIRIQQPDIQDAALQLALFDRFYGDDYGDEEQAWIRRRLAAWGPPRRPSAIAPDRHCSVTTEESIRARAVRWLEENGGRSREGISLEVQQTWLETGDVCGRAPLRAVWRSKGRQ